MTEDLMAPLTGLSNLQGLRLSLPFRRCSWEWLHQLLRLTSIYISDCGTPVCVDGMCLSEMSYAAAAPPAR